ncbi:hypothetical protein K2173_013813 [Erythroxylum novogranatense]|uniref:Uncharacterized protein n=1 Tax=Erythroxylum novogranatense TaxID=1862640 RepID=A0AAV8SCX8_9ROSI|nr:hypothetical protein K2173_013813 [Erythroxylum novogranatense]
MCLAYTKEQVLELVSEIIQENETVKVSFDDQISTSIKKNENSRLRTNLALSLEPRALCLLGFVLINDWILASGMFI